MTTTYNVDNWDLLNTVQTPIPPEISVVVALHFLPFEVLNNNIKKIKIENYRQPACNLHCLINK